ncbi:MAG: hypothetical protein JGK17_08945 [Microcoleus sp. PH2017_10_PVI_O_A]|uniref:hypothetical protein n=1 Tax=unclassified Microcoleus TaxID=2642155 RepID=UPI001DDCA3C4|nr:MULTISPECIES: hypothetical protein [unclassified Microcoleus]MCC3405705.1 hypothetical protein [Microcoleus sp. PH2017_10_PVI_O_A]MCC3478170.1 hypothetical protein [Microcoleus sp. PH2017_12_PCY_D_A]MCC3527363.1 hypothetical protein [Microcoleus sp. PH2017_21_RUC_O_A]MCC3539444.1 hypothetical protein [Microcoleus sp. PH2017_22_RUC_O_B]
MILYQCAIDRKTGRLKPPESQTYTQRRGLKNERFLDRYAIDKKTGRLKPRLYKQNPDGAWVEE